MKTLITAAMYGLVPVPPAQARHAFGDNDDQPPMPTTRTPPCLHGIATWRRMTRSCASATSFATWTPTHVKAMSSELPGHLCI